MRGGVGIIPIRACASIERRRACTVRAYATSCAPCKENGGALRRRLFDRGVLRQREIEGEELESSDAPLVPIDEVPPFMLDDGAVSDELPSVADGDVRSRLDDDDASDELSMPGALDISPCSAFWRDEVPLAADDAFAGAVTTRISSIS